MCYIELGEFEKSIGIFQRLDELFSHYLAIHFHKGTAYMKLYEEDTGATLYLERAINEFEKSRESNTYFTLTRLNLLYLYLLNGQADRAENELNHCVEGFRSNWEEIRKEIVFRLILEDSIDDVSGIPYEELRGFRRLAKHVEVLSSEVVLQERIRMIIDRDDSKFDREFFNFYAGFTRERNEDLTEILDFFEGEGENNDELSNNRLTVIRIERLLDILRENDPLGVFKLYE